MFFAPLCVAQNLKEALGARPENMYAPTQPYTKIKLREPPRVLVPPPHVTLENGQGAFIIKNDFQYDYGSDEFGNPYFIRTLIHNSNYLLKFSMFNWKYESRREAQAIVPYLYLGPTSAARDPDFVRVQEITLFIAIRSASAARISPRLNDAARFASCEGRQSTTVDVDAPFELIQKLPAIVKLINDHLEAGSSIAENGNFNTMQGKVLVFCESGNDRSAIVVSAYLMVVYGFDAVTAIQIVQSQRFCVSLDDAQKQMLIAFEDLLNAKRQVAIADAVNVSRKEDLDPATDGKSGKALRVLKRSIDEAYDDDEEMQDYDNTDLNTTNARAPFRDEESI